METCHYESTSIVFDDDWSFFVVCFFGASGSTAIKMYCIVKVCVFYTISSHLMIERVSD
jgi:hypothetical protein